MSEKIVQCAEKPCDEALDQGDGVWTVPDSYKVDVVAIALGVSEPTSVAARDVVSPRYDLPEDHPLRGYRVIKAGWAGQCDRVMGEDGNIYPVPNQAELERLIAEGVVKKV